MSGLGINFSDKNEIDESEILYIGGSSDEESDGDEENLSSESDSEDGMLIIAYIPTITHICGIISTYTGL